MACRYEITNAIMAATPFMVTVYLIFTTGINFPRMCLLVAWTAQLPTAVAYHLMAAHGHDNDVMLRMDKTLQISGAVLNLLGQSGNIRIVILFTGICVHFVFIAGIWDLQHPLDVNLTRTLTLVATAVSCLPLLVNQVDSFAIAIGSLLLASPLLLFVLHPLVYTPFHLLLGVLTWALIA
eukprot:2200140-Rhodomonas_salina.1